MDWRPKQRRNKQLRNFEINDGEKGTYLCE